MLGLFKKWEVIPNEFHTQWAVVKGGLAASVNLDAIWKGSYHKQTYCWFSDPVAAITRCYRLNNSKGLHTFPTN